jgi:diguanylate cyclase (GGDEF)-like protein
MTNGRDRGVSYGFDETAVQRAVALHALTDDQDVADVDQGAADADQAASDADEVASQRDDDDATRDQRSADRDQAIADQRRSDPAGDAGDDAYESTRAARAASRIGRLASHGDRAGTAGSRLASARGRDRNASARDDTARRREARALLLEEDVATSNVPVREKLGRLRELAKADRARAAGDRVRASTARTAASAERARLQALAHGAFLDDLTGAFRRDPGLHALALEIDRARWGDGRFVLALVAVDGLAAINERAGYAAGDHVLRTLAVTLRAGLRSFDPIVRLGGDHFACGMVGADVDDVDRRFDGIRRSLHADTGVAISVGWAALADGEALAQVTARADAALLDATRSRPA